MLLGLHHGLTDERDGKYLKGKFSVFEVVSLQRIPDTFDPGFIESQWVNLPSRNFGREQAQFGIERVPQ